ncbi:putative G-protein coupled receptor Mth-like 3 [Lycorma delicatula]|uniref:putative G-protein coupled receptor Mth-like 3 n=1 Tax=Lycorma delicatula TaxID=130591 RepID=UPI003F51773D
MNLLVIYELLLLLILPRIITSENKLPCEKWNSIALKNPVKYENKNILSDGVLYPSNLTFSDGDEVRYCHCFENICLRKCCSKGYSMNKLDSCVKSKAELNLKDIKNYSLKESIIDTNKFKIIIYPIELSCVFGTYNLEANKYVINNNGSITTYYDNETVLVGTDENCLEWHENAGRIVSMTCYDFIYYGEQVYTDLVFVTISIPFLVITFALYCIIPDLNNNTLGKNLLSLISSILLLDFTFIIQSLLILNEYKWIAKILAYPRVYGMLGNFFWLNVMCFDIWLVFSGYSQSFHNLTKHQQTKRFLKYSIYAWSMPVVICTVRALIARKLYQILFKAVVTTLLLLNVVFFATTAYNMYDHNKKTKVLKSKPHKSDDKKQEREWLYLYLKLFLVMGIPWIAEPLSLLLPKLIYLWYGMFLFNILQGPLIFIIFICKRSILNVINVKLWPSKIIFTYEKSHTSSQSNRDTESSGAKHTSTYHSDCNAKENIELQGNEMVELKTNGRY